MEFWNAQKRVYYLFVVSVSHFEKEVECAWYWRRFVSHKQSSEVFIYFHFLTYSSSYFIRFIHFKVLRKRFSQVCNQI